MMRGSSGQASLLLCPWHLSPACGLTIWLQGEEEPRVQEFKVPNKHFFKQWLVFVLITKNQAGHAGRTFVTAERTDQASAASDVET